MDAIDFTGATRPMVLEFVPRKYPMHTLRQMATVPATTVRQRAVVLCPLEQQLCGLTRRSLGRAVEGGEGGGAECHGQPPRARERGGSARRC
jgi:hypothetical protein